MTVHGTERAAWRIGRRDEEAAAPLQASQNGFGRLSAHVWGVQRSEGIAGLSMMGRFLEMLGPLRAAPKLGIEGMVFLAELADLGRPQGNARQRIRDLADLALRGVFTQRDRDLLRSAVARLMAELNRASNDDPHLARSEELCIVTPDGRAQPSQNVSWACLSLAPTLDALNDATQIAAHNEESNAEEISRM
ncbi:hypothetical protein [Magnetofaba australis]|uniref:hypothetical protein n=1 Tax=Magnetofaba australis TaxID=1472297 RepID=UPI000A19FC8F|nr:hypothetical protein [Magnetofaba australis]